MTDLIRRILTYLKMKNEAFIEKFERFQIHFKKVYKYNATN